MQKGTIKAGEINTFLQKYFGEDKAIVHLDVLFGEEKLDNIDPELPLTWEEYIPGEAINFFDLKSDEDWGRKFQAAFNRFPGKDYGQIQIEQISFNVDMDPELLRQELKDEWHFDEPEDVICSQRILIYVYGAMRNADVEISIEEIAKDFRDRRLVLFDSPPFAIYARTPIEIYILRKAGEMMLLDNVKNDTNTVICTYLICEKLKTI